MSSVPSIKRLALVSTASALLLCGQSYAAENPIRLNFGVYSSNKPSAMVRLFKPTLNALESRMSEHLGREVDIRMQIAKDYDQGISDLTGGRVDFSRFGPASYIEAKRKNDAIRILGMENKKNAKVFYGIIAVGANSKIRTVGQLKDKRFAFGDEGSTIGRFLSQLYLERNGIRAQDLAGYEYLGRHDKVGTAVGAGDYDAGALNESTFKKLIDKGVRIRELARFPNVTKPWIARSGLDEEVFAALQKSLLELKDPGPLKTLKVDGFLPGSDTDYAEIRRAMDKNHMFFDKNITGATEPTANAGPTSPLVGTIPYNLGQSTSPAAAMPSSNSKDVVNENRTNDSVQHASEINVSSHVAHTQQNKDCCHLEINLSLPMNLIRQKDGNTNQSITINLQLSDDFKSNGEASVLAK